MSNRHRVRTHGENLWICDHEVTDSMSNIFLLDLQVLHKMTPVITWIFFFLFLKREFQVVVRLYFVLKLFGWYCKCQLTVLKSICAYLLEFVCEVYISLGAVVICLNDYIFACPLWWKKDSHLQCYPVISYLVYTFEKLIHWKVFGSVLLGTSITGL